MFELKDYVLEIYKAKGFTKAAENLYISQPSLSMSIKRLEEEIGEQIFDRSIHPIQLTECGKQYIETAKIISAAEENFKAFLDNYQNLKTGTISIGGSNTSVSYVLPPLLEKFNALYPQIELELVEGNIRIMKEKLFAGEIDLMIDSCDMDESIYNEYIYNRENLILMIPFNIPCSPEVEQYRLSFDDIMNIKHTGPYVKPLPLNLVGDIPFIWMTPETDTYLKAMKLCDIYSIDPPIRMSFNHQSTAFHVACAGAGATFISDELLRNAQMRPRAYFFKVLPEIGTRYIRFYAKKTHPLTYPMKALLSVAHETGRKFTDKPAY